MPNPRLTVSKTLFPPLRGALALWVAIALCAPAPAHAEAAGDLDWWARLDQLVARRAYPAAEAELSAALTGTSFRDRYGDRARALLGSVQHRAGHRDAALATLAAVGPESHYALDALAERAAIQRERGDDAAAIALYETLLPLADEARRQSARGPLADLYFTSGQFSKALAQYRELANAFGPQQERALFGWGWALLRLGQEEAATNVWRQALERYPASRYGQAVRLALGNLLLARGEHLAASTYYNEAARQGQDEALMARAELLAGEAYADGKDYGLAVSHYRAVPADSPLREPASYGEAWCAWHQGQFSEARKLFGDWMVHWPQSPYRGAALYAIGSIEQALGHGAAAADAYGKVAGVAPRSAWAEDASYQLVAMAFGRQDHDETISLGRKLEATFPRSKWLGPVLWMRGESYLGLGLYQEAVKAYTQLAVLGNLGFLAGQGEQVDFKIGMAYFYSGSYADAARQLESVAAGPLADDAMFWQAEARYRLGQYDSARALYGRLIARFPEFARLAEGYYGLGWACYRLNDFAGAKSAYAEASRRLPEGRTRQDALYRLGLTLVDLHDWDAARATFRTLLDGNPDPATAADARFQSAWSLYRQGKLEEAANAFGSFASANANNRLAPQALIWQGRSLFRTARYADAVGALQAAIMHPLVNSGQLYEAREQLAAAFFNAGQYDESRRVYEQLMQMGDLSAERVEELRSGVIQAHLKAGNFKAARAELAKRAPLGDADQQLLQTIAEAFYTRSDWDEVIATYQVSLPASTPQLTFWAGKASLEKGDFASAVKALEPLRDTRDQELRPQALYELGRAYRGAGDLAVARETLIQLSEAYVNRPVAALALIDAADVARDQHDLPAAQNLYRRVAENRAFTLDRRRQAWMSLGDLQRGQKQWGAALLAYRGARGLGPDASLGSALGGYWAGYVLVEMKQFKEALKELASLRFPAQAEPLPSLAQLKQGEALEKLNRWKEAADLYTRLAAQASPAERVEAKSRLDWIDKNVPKEMRS